MFIGYHDDAVPSMILDLEEAAGGSVDELKRMCKTRLLQSATPDGIMRIPETDVQEDFEDLFQEYFVDQNHDSLAVYMNSLPMDTNLVEVTTHSKLLTSSSVEELSGVLKIPTLITLESLQQFHSEEDFRKALQKFIEQVSSSANKKCALICQVDAGEQSARNLVESARYIIHGYINTIKTMKNSPKFDIFIVMHIPFGSGHYIGYPCSPWRSVHIDELRSQHGVKPMMIKTMRGRSVAEILKTECVEDVGILPLVALVETCVPKAASLIKGGDPSRAVERIDKFLTMFRKNKMFQRINLQKIVQIFERKDEMMENSTSWLFKVSLYSSRLKEGSTYQASVWHHLQEVLSPVLAVILATIDCNKNLDVMDTEVAWRQELFLRVYREVEFEDAETECNSEEILLHKEGPAEFSTKIGFSWLIIHQMSQFSSVHNPEQMTEVSSVLRSLGEAFKTGQNGIVEDFVSDLLSNSMATKKTQGKLLINWILSDCKSLLSEEHRVLSPFDVFNTFQAMQEQISWFKQITDLYPSIVTSVRDEVRAQGKMDRPLSELALKFAIDNLGPVFETFEIAAEREKWINNVNQLQSIAQQMRVVTSDRDGEVQQEDAMWGEWSRVTLFKLFVHHVLSSDIDGDLNKVVCAKLKTVWQTLKDPDMKKHATFKKMIQVLKILNVQAAKLHFTGGVNECVRCGGIPDEAVALPCGHVGCKVCLLQFFEDKDGLKRCPAQKCKNPKIPDDFKVESTIDVVKAVEKHNDFRKKLNLYFIEVLQSSCFTPDGHPPDKKIFEDLLEFVALKSIEGSGVKTKELSPFQEHGIDSSPTIRSFLLQLCLQSDRKMAHEQIHFYMAWSNLDGHFEEDEEVVELATLFMNCVEDVALQKNIGEETLALQAFRMYRDYTFDDHFDVKDIDKLEQLSKLRFAMELLAGALTAHFEDDEGGKHEQLIREARKSLIMKTESMKRFLVKNIALKHRVDIVKLMKENELQEFLPAELLENDDNVVDIYNLFGQSYVRFKSQMKNLDQEDAEMEFQQSLENNDDQNLLLLLLLASCDLQNTFNKFEVEKMKEIVHQKFNDPAVIPLMDNLKIVEEDNRNLDLKKLSIMMKVLTEMGPCSGLLAFFKEIISNPMTMMNKFLPAMPHDVQFEVLQTVGKEYTAAYRTHVKFFACPNGHVYGIGDCTRPNQGGRCADCGAAIGAQRYNVLQHGNVAIDPTDQTRTGFVKHNDLTEGLRGLTLFETEIIAILTHLGCLAASFSNKTAVAAFCQEPENNVEAFLLQQINHKIRKVARLGGRSQDDIIVLIGLLIKSLGANRAQNFDLLQKQGRINWEKNFADVLQMCVKSLPKEMVKFREAVKMDSDDSALQMIINSEDDDSILDKLLRVRFRISAENLLQWIISNNKVEAAPTLHEILLNINVLQDLANLPSILHLQNYLVKKFNGKVSREELEKISIADFFERIEESFRGMFSNLVEKLMETWERQKENVLKFGGVIAEELKRLDSFKFPVNPQVTPAAFLFPASSRSGLCSYSLVMFLVETHNLTVKSDLPPINPYKATIGHLATLNKSDVSALLLAHTSYSIPRKGVTKEEYDIEGMERKVVYR